jgi:NAD(P)H-hydrate epimerase
MQAAERAADAAGLSYDQMMENAGVCVAQAIMGAFDVTDARVLVLVGPGNNGGDGLVVARHLAQNGAIVTVYVWKRNITNDHNWALLDDTAVERLFWDADASQTQLVQLLNGSAIIVDSLLGTGVSRPIAGTLAQLLAQTRTIVTARRTPRNSVLTQPALPNTSSEFGPIVMALDLPSGLNSDTGEIDPFTISADFTVTLAAVKRGHLLLPAPNVVGQLVVGDIGIEPQHYPPEVSLEVATPATAARMLPNRPAVAHKGTFGTALIVAGSINYPGAALLAGQSATRIGTGLVTMAVPHTIYPIIAAGLAEATYQPLPDRDGYVAEGAVAELQQKFDRAGALLIGPGLNRMASTAAFLRKLLQVDDLPPLVLDADALNILSTQSEWWKSLPPASILTPHPGEMARLMGSTVKHVQQNRLELAPQMARKWQQVVLLKGAHTVIAAPDGRTVVLPFANPGLAKAGSGDVLAGAIVGLRAQNLDPFEAAVAGGYLHGVAGELVRQKVGEAGTLAGDLTDLLPTAMLEVAGV